MDHYEDREVGRLFRFHGLKPKCSNQSVPDDRAAPREPTVLDLDTVFGFLPI